MNRPMDVMVFCPVYRLEPETVEALCGLAWDGPLTVVWQRDNPRRTDDARADGWANHLHQYQRGQETFLAGRYDAMLVIESDMIPPADTLQRLAALPCDVAFGCYQFRQNAHVNILERREAWPGQVRSMGGVLTATAGLWERAQAQGVIDCTGSGLGCTLIRRAVLEMAPFEAGPGGGWFDYPWVVTVATQGWRMMADCNLHVGHVDVDGRVLWPEGVGDGVA